VLSAGISVRHAANESGCWNTPKLAAANNEIAGQSASVMDRSSNDVDAAEASTELDAATKRCLGAFDFRLHRIRCRCTKGAFAMATDLTLYLDDQPGELARVGDVLGKAGTNIAGLCALTSGGGRAEVHILVDDPTPAFEALKDAGITIADEEEVIVLEVEDRPGALGEVARKLGDANVNLTTAYLATNTRLVLGADNLAAAKSALS
jgi:hypothetical protein